MPRLHRVALISVGIAAVLTSLAVQAVQIDIPGPPGSLSFGTQVKVLSNGNFVVTDFGGGGAGVGAVYLYGPGGTLISTLKGSSTNDFIGSSVVPLSNGNFVVASKFWHNGAADSAGAVTWVNGTTGLNGTVSAANSFVGSHLDDGYDLTITPLPNGNYVIGWPGWENPGGVGVGAVTWCDGSAACVGTVSAANSLIGSHASDFGDFCRIVPLRNGHYLVVASNWDNGSAFNAGAVTWMNGTARSPVGPIGAANSLVGSSNSDYVGSEIAVLSNGHYVAGSNTWDDVSTAGTDNGAVTWCNGSTAGPRCTGAVSRSNSLFGGVNDFVGTSIVALTNGNYVVSSQNYSNGATTNAGAVTWANGATGRTGLVWVGNSLVGTHVDDFVGTVGALSNGNYVVRSPSWSSNSVTDAGAVTWGDGSSGITGAVSNANSLIGSADGDRVGDDVLALSNGHYVVCSPDWNDFGFIPGGGAATWGNGSTAGPRTTGSVTATNSLYGAANYHIGDPDCGVALENGNYVVSSPDAFGEKGAASWGDGNSGVVGGASTANSLVGTSFNDHVAKNVFALGHSNYLVVSDLGSSPAYGGVTWSRGNKALVGTFNASQSLVGAALGDRLGSGGVKSYADGAYVVYSPDFQSAGVEVGAYTVGNSVFRLKGLVNAGNSVVGTVFNNGASLTYDYDPTHAQLVVGRRQENVVTLFKTDAIFPDGFDE